MNRLSKFFDLPLHRKWMLFRIWFLMQGVAVGLRLLSLRRLVDVLGTNRPDGNSPKGTGKEDILWSVRACAPFSLKSTCVVQGLAAERMLRHAGFRVAFRVGVYRQDAFRAHAWVEDESGVLIGQTEDELQPLPVIPGPDFDPGSLKFLL